MEKRFYFILGKSIEGKLLKAKDDRRYIKKSDSDLKIKIKPPPCSKEELQKLIKYNPETGLFKTNFVTRGRPDIKLGTPVGSLSKEGYITISIKGKRYKAHKVAHYYMTGKWEQVDHKDLNRSNNSYSNLRPATYYDNQRNKIARKGQKYPKGVTKNRNHFKARICIGYKRIGLGNFETPELAHEAYCKAAKLLHGEFANY